MRVSTTSHRVMIVHLCRTTHFFVIGVAQSYLFQLVPTCFFQWVKLSGTGV